MIIKQITIKNFRSYYGEQTIELGDNLTIIIGDNGDGKTTFYEAIEWLLETTGSQKMEQSHVSQKRWSELLPGESDKVSVSIDFDHDGPKGVTKSFIFKKESDGSMKTEQYSFDGFVETGSERQPISGKELIERCFGIEIRKYHLFKGETQMNIFGNDDAVENLINRFSEVKQFDPFYSGDEYNLGFTEYAVDMSQKTLNSARVTESKNNKKLKSLSDQMKLKLEAIGQNEADYRNCKKNFTDFSEKLDSLEENREASTLLRQYNERLASLREDKDKKERKILEDYSTRLLDDSWILYGIVPTLDKYRTIVDEFRKQKQKIQIHEARQQGKKDAIKEIRDGVLPLDPLIPDRATMEDMIHDEFCKVCGRPAPKGTESYEFMVRKLESLIESLEPKKEDETPIFPNDYANELLQRSHNVDFRIKYIKGLKKKIRDDIAFNIHMHQLVDEAQEKINKIIDDKNRLLAQTDGLSEDQLENAYENITNWFKDKTRAEKEMGRLKLEHEALQAEYDELQRQYSGISQDSQSNIYAQINTALRFIKDAFKSAKERNTRNFLDLLEKESNEFLSKLNVEGFHGIIRIEKYLQGANVALFDEHDTRITKPNQALLTTVYMSVLFAISKLTSVMSESTYPLIFDAPTSSFSAQTEQDFYNVITTLDKQCLIVTKSFLKEDGLLDMGKVKNLNCRVYRMAKKKPFVKTDLSTIQTTLTLIKE